MSWRLIRNGSKCQGIYGSLNSGITNQDYIKIRLKNFKDYCTFFRSAGAAAGFDIKKAYRNCFIHPQDQK